MDKKQIKRIIGHNIRQARLNSGLTIEQLAEVMQISPSYIGLIERGNRGTTIYHLLLFSYLLNTPVNDLVNIVGIELYPQESTDSNFNSKLKYIKALLSRLTERDLNFFITVIEAYRENHTQTVS
jgi:transcriptional regulator with XRE-family HTH domain